MIYYGLQYVYAVIENKQMVTHFIKYILPHSQSHLTFSTHIKEQVASTRKFMFTIVKLKWCLISKESLIKLYCGKLWKELTYAAPAWCTHLSSKCVDDIQRVQRLATKIIYPDYFHTQKNLNFQTKPLLKHIWKHSVNNISLRWVITE